MKLLLVLLLLLPLGSAAQMPKIEPGVSQELAKWRAAHYSDVRYKLNLTLEKMSPVLKGTIEIRVKVTGPKGEPPASAGGFPIVLDWRKIKGNEQLSTISNLSLNGVDLKNPPADAGGSPFEADEHLIFRDGVVAGENVIKLDFTSPILTSGSAITRYIDKEDGSEYIYSLFVPSDASTAFPVFDQPDLKATFNLKLNTPANWTGLSNAEGHVSYTNFNERRVTEFAETLPISTYVFAFAAGPFAAFASTTAIDAPVYFDRSNLFCTMFPSRETKCITPTGGDSLTISRFEKLPPGVTFKDLLKGKKRDVSDNRSVSEAGPRDLTIYVRHSQAVKFEAHAAETFRLTRESVKYLETYFDYKFPWPKYDIVLIPEFPFGGMEHAGATFLRESSVIFPTEPTKGDQISRANLIFHETAHQWFGDTVTMRWFDDLWLKEGFAEFMAYKTLEKVMPDANAWKVFYERNKQAAYATDSTRGTTPIYQPIANLSAAKSAYGNIVYRKAPSFLRQAEFYLGEEKFQTAVRAFLKKHEYANAGWEDLVGEFEGASGRHLQEWASKWITQPGLATLRLQQRSDVCISQISPPEDQRVWPMKLKVAFIVNAQHPHVLTPAQDMSVVGPFSLGRTPTPLDIALKHTSDRSAAECILWNDVYQIAVLPNYGDYGYGIFLLDDKSRDYVLKHIGEEKDPFLRSMMWGALWDSVREAELDPREYVELVIRQLGGQPDQRGGQVAEARASARAVAKAGTTETDETIVASLLGRVSVALNYYLPAPSIALANARASATSDLRSRFEAVLLERMQHAETAGQRITFYRAFVTNVSTEKGRTVLKQMLAQSTQSRVSVPPAVAGGSRQHPSNDTQAGSLRSDALPTFRTKDRFDIVTRLAILGDPDAPKLLADLEKTETSDDAKRYAYAAHAAFATADSRAKYWNDLVNNKDISESWIEAAIIPFNSIRYPELSQRYLERALTELPNLKRTRKIFFINNWLAAWIGGQRDEKALAVVNKFLADNPNLDNDLRLKVLENVDLIERAVKIRQRWNH